MKRALNNSYVRREIVRCLVDDKMSDRLKEILDFYIQIYNYDMFYTVSTHHKHIMEDFIYSTWYCKNNNLPYHVFFSRIIDEAFEYLLCEKIYKVDKRIENINNILKKINETDNI